MNLTKIKLSIAALVAALSVGGIVEAQTLAPDVVHATMPGPVQMGNGVYHRAVCYHGFLRPGVMACHAHVRTDATGKVFMGKSLTAALAVQPAGYGAFDLRSAYQVVNIGLSTTTVAVVDAYGYPHAGADLTVYRTQMGLPACTGANGCFKKINQTGGTTYPAFDLGWAEETALDLDMVSAMCPNCHILLVEANSANVGDLAIAENRAVTQGAHVISNSYGGGESGMAAFESAWNHAGIAITVSSGDSGYGVQFPAASPHVTAVGGTSLSRMWNVRGWKETAWTGAGSGCSTVFTKPTWQHDALCTMRTVADVSAIADPATGVAVYSPYTDPVSATWLWFGGTSVAAPIIAGIYGVNGGAVNYGQNPYLNKLLLFDVLTGSNGSCGGTYLCTARTGYDGPTGLGTPKGETAF